MISKRNLFTVFQKSIGQNLENDPSDIINVKNKLSSLNHYKDKNKSGYITHELDNSIRTYQRDRNLKIDGKILPGGETEATLFGDLFGMKKNESNLKTSNAALIPLIFKGASRAYIPAKKAWDAWQKVSPSIRQDEIDRKYDECYKNYKENLKDCDYITENFGKNKGRKCFENAADNLAKCQKYIK